MFPKYFLAMCLNFLPSFGTKLMKLRTTCAFSIRGWSGLPEPEDPNSNARKTQTWKLIQCFIYKSKTKPRKIQDLTYHYFLKIRNHFYFFFSIAENSFLIAKKRILLTILVENCILCATTLLLSENWQSKCN